MGDLQGCPPPQCNGHRQQPPAFLSLTQAHENPRPSDIASESWFLAEQATGDIIRGIQPTVASEERRLAVINYVQRILGMRRSIQVFPFGSVPLKTYLPDGDIDLTAIGLVNVDDDLTVEVRNALEAEEQNTDSEFEVKDVQYIHAEVKLVKCLVQNIVVDISFSQIGGLCTLCFLEKADCLIGKENLFKRSIILIKAWCYYESRILGAHHGLISTYALETLVLYIFHLFHSSLDGPLMVLYRFLDYYSQFDWDNYCISLWGPIPVSSLPELAALPPEPEGSDLLLTSEFLKSCVDNFTAPSRGLESGSRVFLQKHLNIVDPLKENNNLGRSVSKGNYYRIRSAFSYGARKLGRILLLPSGRIEEEINLFFMNTLDRHGNCERPDIHDSSSRFLNNRRTNPQEELVVEEVKHDKLQSSTAECRGKSCRESDIANISESHKELDRGMDLVNHPAYPQPAARFNMNGSGEAGVVSGRLLAGNAHDHSNAQSDRSKILNVPLANGESAVSSSEKTYHARHILYSPKNGGFWNSDSNVTVSVSNFTKTKLYDVQSNTNSFSSSGRHVLIPFSGSNEGVTSPRSSFSMRNAQHMNGPLAKNSDVRSIGIPESQILFNLSGDFDTHFSNLQCAKLCQEYPFSGLVLPNNSPSAAECGSEHSRNMFPDRNMFVHMNMHGPHFSPIFYSAHPTFMPGGYIKGDISKSRGTGMYHPNTNNPTYKDRQSTGGGRSTLLTNQISRPRNNGRPLMPPVIIQEKIRHDTHEQRSPTYNSQNRKYHNHHAPLSSPSNLLDKGRHDTKKQSSTSAWNGHGKSGLLDLDQPIRSGTKGIPLSNNSLQLPEERLEFGTLGPFLYCNSAREQGGKFESVNTYRHAYGHVVPLSTVNQPVQRSDSDRPKQSYHLKDDNDFPPLTG